MPSLQQITFDLRGEFITLDKLLKACSVASSGGEAKFMVAEGMVQVDGQDESRKTAKIRAGQVVSLRGVRIHVVADPNGSASSPTADGEAND
jgi:ribosome-associated protein